MNTNYYIGNIKIFGLQMVLNNNILSTQSSSSDVHVNGGGGGDEIGGKDQNPVKKSQRIIFFTHMSLIFAFHSFTFDCIYADQANL